MTMVVRRSMIRSAGAASASGDFDRDVRRIGDDVVDRGALLRLRDDRFDVLLRRVRVDVERHLDVVVAVADVAVDSQDALDVHRPFELRFDRAQLDAAVLRDGGDAGGQAAREADEDELDRRGAEVLGGEDLRVVGVERELGLVLLVLAEAVELLDLRLAVGAVLPLAGRPPLELRGLGGVPERFPRRKQCPYVDAVVDAGLSHRALLYAGSRRMELAVRKPRIIHRRRAPWRRSAKSPPGRRGV